MASILNVDQIGHSTSGTTALTVDSNGRILTPARPAFRAVLGTATAGQDYTTQQLIPVDTEKFDIGNNFDLSTKEFVAPIAGVYQFNALMAFGGVAGATSVALYLYKNDVLETDTGNQVSSDDPQSGGQASISYSGCLQLAANDKVEFQFIVIADTASNINSAEFSGFLVG